MKNMFFAAGLALALSAPANAVVDISGFALDAGAGDGFVAAPDAPFLFTLFGSDNQVSFVTTNFGRIAATDLVVTGKFRYQTNDAGGSSFDQAGFYVHNDFTRLSVNGQPNGSSNSGTFQFGVKAGQNYGFYINSTDGVLGRGQLSVSNIPEPGTWAMMIAGFGLVGAAMRRRRPAPAA